jgi:hypothetical protein
MVASLVGDSEPTQMHGLTGAKVVFLSLGAILILENWVGIAEASRTRVRFSCVPILGDCSDVLVFSYFRGSGCSP